MRTFHVFVGFAFIIPKKIDSDFDFEKNRQVHLPKIEVLIPKILDSSRDVYRFLLLLFRFKNLTFAAEITNKLTAIILMKVAKNEAKLKARSEDSRQK